MGLRVIAGSSIRFCGLCGAVPGSAIIADMRLPAAAISGWISLASGRFCQYFFGISFSIAFTFSRAGLKMLA